MKYKPDICHVRDCMATSTNAESQIFPVAGDMRYLPVVLSSVARKFRNKKSNFMCKAHFLPEDLPPTRSGFMLSKRAVPCLQVPSKTLKMVIRSGISPKHSEVAGALLERARVVQNSRDSSSDSDSPSEPMAPSGASQSPSAKASFGFSYVDSSLGSLQASEVGATQTYVPEPTALTLQQRLQLAGKPSIKRYAENYISRHDSGFIDYKRLKISDSESPQSQAEGDAASDASNGNSRAVEEIDDEDEITDVTEVGVTVPRDDGEEAMDEDDGEVDDHAELHGPVRSHVKTGAASFRGVGRASLPRHVTHSLPRSHCDLEEEEDDDDDDEEDEHHPSGGTIEEVDDDDDASLDGKDPINAKRSQPQDDDDDGDDDDEGSAIDKLKKFRKHDEPLVSTGAENMEEFDEEEAFAEGDEQLHNRRCKRPRGVQEDREHRSEITVEEENEDGDDEQEQDGVDEDEKGRIDDEGHKSENAAIPPITKVQKSSCDTSRDSP